jgi:hypothetical protein
VSERSRQDAEEGRIEETVAQPEASPDLVVSSVERATPGDDEVRERPSLLDMLFREAEVIARNLKESGTRR